jgi:tetratricopeptide (TPR) repeat protein
MDHTKKELEDNWKSSAKTVAAVDALEPVLRPLIRSLWRIGFIGRFLGRTTGGRTGAISRYTKRGEHDRAADLAIEALKEYRHQPEGTWSPSGRDYWWMFMHFAARSLEECGDQEKRDQVIEMARNGVEPFHGYHVALSFLAFSRWKYREGDYDAAIEFAEIAANADETWAEPDFVLGWYCSVLGIGDAMKHLARAVRKDRRILSRIAQDPVCGRHPHIIQKLKNLSFDDDVTVRDRAGAEDDDDKAD